jgi:hypothetical protein
MLRLVTAAVAATAALAVSACGSSSGADSGVSVSTAKSTVERTADVRLTSMPVPDEAADQGLKASYSNAATAAKDGQVVLLFVLKNSDVAKEVGPMLKDSVPKPAKLIKRDNLLVVYSAQGTDHGAEVKKAVAGL